MTTATVTKDAKAVASAYFEAWKARDFDTFRFLLTDEVEFVGPLAHLHNADDCVKMVPALGRSRPTIRRPTEVLPLPLSPTMPRISPSRTWKVACFTASKRERLSPRKPRAA